MRDRRVGQGEVFQLVGIDGPFEGQVLVQVLPDGFEVDALQQLHRVDGDGVGPALFAEDLLHISVVLVQLRFGVCRSLGARASLQIFLACLDQPGVEVDRGFLIVVQFVVLLPGQHALLGFRLRLLLLDVRLVIGGLRRGTVTGLIGERVIHATQLQSRQLVLVLGQIALLPVLQILRRLDLRRSIRRRG